MSEYTDFSGASSANTIQEGGLDFIDFNNNMGFDDSFQRLVKLVRNDAYLHRLGLDFSELSCLVKDFKHAALCYGKVIIAEKSLESSKKTIKPVTHVGGIAGGEKFIAGDIFFRFPHDLHDIYGSDELAGKEANHQIKGLTSMYNVNVDLLLPLMAIIKVRYMFCSRVVSYPKKVSRL